MMTINSKLGFLLTAIVLSGCATNNEYAKFPKPAVGESVLIVPVGSIEAIHSSDKTGFTFGLIGALVEAAVTAKSSEETGKAISAELVQAKIEDYLGQQVLNNVAKCGVSGSVHKEVVVNTDKEWLESPKSVLPQIAKIKENYVIETGALNMLIRDGLVTKSICIRGAAKVFRTSDELLVNKVPVSKFDRLACPKNNLLEHFSNNDPEKLNELVRLTKTALEQLALKMSEDICSNVK